jgi:Flp pilus assembly protein TadG
MRRLTSLFARFRDRTDGIAAVEFALILPIMAVMLIGAVQISDAVTADRRVSQVSSSTGDLIARIETDIAKSEIEDIAKIGGWLMAPFRRERLEIDLSLVTLPCPPSPAVCPTTPPAVNQANQRLRWECKYVGSTNTMTCTCPKTPYTMPRTGLINFGDAVVISTARYAYQPAFFDTFFRYNATVTLADTAYLKPRGVCTRLNDASLPGGQCTCFD